ncbi:succinylglutamate-semialdehyde dehydrogenase [Pelagibaculum spongiae]|uniref:N-succinylglutamate 5-semialdehyde dehydrogenase n=1 Tax=Pelagibaculum spongiae TaxID=2080658 RepID=A0A2V1H145_9GAMM|nr:succinylglutamate-semialdehyde dehydrogenase [Pelagibaculum spongiae]PVZ72203.1 succinylglutamate-semialdehyde dehydrogenase [Pelagibaculum spongiae]
MKQSLFINGQWISGDGPELISINPANNQLIWQGNTASIQQVDLAFTSARSAYKIWSSYSFIQRRECIERYVDILKQAQNELATTIALETGKPLWEAKTEVAAMIGKVAISVTAYQQRTGEQQSQLAAGLSIIRHKPHGVVAIFGPFNFPGHLPNGHIIPALLAGNCIVFKPSEMTPKTAEMLIQFWQKIGLPDGVINLLQGERAVGKAITEHQQLDGLFFTGSSQTGHLLHQQFSGHPEKILALEMGGNNPLIIESVSDISAAVHEIIQSAFITAGQRCTCARRVFIPDNEMGSQLKAQLIQATSKITVGQPLDEPQPFMGSLISEAAANHMLEVQQTLIDLGGRSLLSMQKQSANSGLITPGIIDVTAIKQLPDEEYFGPLIQLIHYQSFDQAIELANQTRFGLSAGLFSEDREKFDYFYQHIRAGIVNWNKSLTGASSSAPFGGVGASGNHHPSAFYAADYCSYPVASIEAEQLSMPEKLAPGLTI